MAINIFEDLELLDQQHQDAVDQMKVDTRTRDRPTIFAPKPTRRLALTQRRAL